MDDYINMPYYTLKAECKKQGLDSKGTKLELLARMGVTDTTKQPEQPEPEIKAPTPETTIIQATQEELNAFLPGATGKPVIDTSKYAAWLTNERLEKLTNKIAPLAAGKGSFKFDIDHEGGAYQIEFRGKGPVVESTTLIDTDNQIIARATQYFNARLAMGGNGQTSKV